VPAGVSKLTIDSCDTSHAAPINSWRSIDFGFRSRSSKLMRHCEQNKNKNP
jgi:hypothetical protein